MSFSEFTAKDYEVIAREYAELKEMARKRCARASELDIIQKAFDFANEAHKNVRRRSGEPYILHPIAVAKIVVGDIGLGYKSISAALLHDVVEDTEYTVADIALLLEEKGLIRDAKLFELQEKLSGLKEGIAPGTYKLNTAMTIEEMLTIMAADAATAETEES